MALKLFLNVLYTIGIFVCAAIAYWGYQHTRYEFIMGGVFVAALLIVLKIKLLKDLRAPQK
jgi:hypothetical protein